MSTLLVQMMLDPEAIIVKGGILVLALFTVIRFILHDFNNLVNDFRRTRRALTHNVHCEPYPYLRLGQRVRIRGGCLAGVEGVLAAFGGNGSLILSVKLLRRSVAVQISGCHVQPL